MNSGNIDMRRRDIDLKSGNIDMRRMGIDLRGADIDMRRMGIDLRSADIDMRVSTDNEGAIYRRGEWHQQRALYICHNKKMPPITVASP